MKNTVKMIVDRNKLTVKFEASGDIWKWVGKGKNKNSRDAYRILESVRDGEIHDFAYEMYLDKFIKKYSQVNAIEVV